MLNDLKNRGMQCVLFFCVDELPYFKEVIRAIFPQSKIQRCVIHMLWNPFKYINYNDWRKFLTDFESVYNALNENAARAEQEDIQDKWGKKDPHAISNWENNWQDVNSFFSFLRKSDGLCTRQISLKGWTTSTEKYKNQKRIFGNAPLKRCVYLASGNIRKKWNQRYHGCDQVLNQ